MAGIGTQYNPDQLRGSLVTVLENIEPTQILGIKSEVMILAAEDDGKIALLKPDKSIKLGSKIC